MIINVGGFGVVLSLFGLNMVAGSDFLGLLCFGVVEYLVEKLMVVIVG
jgi:hypothetical protein